MMQALWDAFPPLYGGGFLVAFAQVLLTYYAGGAVFHWVVPRFRAFKGIQKHSRSPEDLRRDAVQSLGPCASKAAMWAIIEQLHAHGYGKLYEGPVSSRKELVYLIATIVAMDYVYDAWFYWTHRLLHWRPMYKYVHFEHHLSTVPTAFTGYSFHILEGLIVFIIQVPVIFFFPIHATLHRLYHMFTVLVHEAGHCGHEVFPFIPTLPGVAALILRGIRGSPLINSVQHHDLHHRYGSVNYSLYFSHWDRWMDTLHEKYDAQMAKFMS